ncbi:hypothetical protein [Gloeocapsopsis dulcis]|uniref:CopG family transcriptional regulator n=1 Tax=Gloeocapsopsis dulcis AAB1 = 1H9 TaxID=1433147 RepID=A0A6N8FUE8_9CHRO|nr:hypothetical protein [Gloeocapsopsis dulcis]MUL35566.1 hypothetical protein [Gloeocapsopsis dulcis AAB1 = 1H9]WNN87529.1 hypothetical protein P0S91_14480 [Gloeocapsopsis dulcis]
MKRTIYLPDDIAERLNKYLIDHPNETLSSVVQEALEKKLAPKDVSKLLSFAGIVQNASCNAADNAEDRDAIASER